MPFKKQGPDDYTGPSGRHFNTAQVRLYYAHGGSFPKHAEGGPVAGYAKGGDVRVASYAAGGPVLGRNANFMKVKDEFRDPDEGDNKPDIDNLYAKSGVGAGTGEIKPPKAAGKTVKGPKPRS